MTPEQWRDLFIGDIKACKSKPVLRRWGVNYAAEIKQRCPAYVEEIRERYAERMGELNGK